MTFSKSNLAWITLLLAVALVGGGLHLASRSTGEETTERGDLLADDGEARGPTLETRETLERAEAPAETRAPETQ